MTDQWDNTAKWNPPVEPIMAEFGPQRVIGMAYVGKNEQGEIPALWEKTFMPRWNELGCTNGPGGTFGICRCVPGVTDGSFEYIAACGVDETQSVPEGMIELRLAQSQYLVITVPELAQIGAAWAYPVTWLSDHPEWEPYCGPNGCQCPTHPGFELYPSDFGKNGQLFLYIPLFPRKR